MRCSLRRFHRSRSPFHRSRSPSTRVNSSRSRAISRSCSSMRESRGSCSVRGTLPWHPTVMPDPLEKYKSIILDLAHQETTPLNKYGSLYSCRGGSQLTSHRGGDDLGTWNHHLTQTRETAPHPHGRCNARFDRSPNDTPSPRGLVIQVGGQAAPAWSSPRHQRQVRRWRRSGGRRSHGSTRVAGGRRSSARLI